MNDRSHTGEEDLSCRVQELEQRVAELTEALDASNRELQTFSYSVSHDLRAPLTIIDGFARALMEDCAEQLDAQGQEYLKRIRIASQRMGNLINGLLNLSRIAREPLCPDTANLSEIVRTIEMELRYLHPERSVLFTIEDGVTAQGDRRLLRTVMDNLLRNAWKFTVARDPAHISFGSCVQEGKTAYFVKDDGAGFDMAFADRLFIPFQRMHQGSEFEGVGIGLATAHRIIQRHGGRIWAEAAPDAGATFYFTLTG
ncbi:MULTISPECIES: sensor histidine kinase [Geobacter]|uniref:sensor histidine kinase n=1 Tax=Geobacter TaxID=28231 RepID=UPI002573B49C|nr:ATP-binding protein [Geobacter sulfurreducens]BEH09481.1 ATP-binding protein [Geobacter sulfurreducens subsp. ethanolicus]BET57364.1 ATP-binding protein [Geobacter sp. 60473]HML78588.1 ATP-binding protein [Geobacter sulfurreducens]